MFVYITYFNNNDDDDANNNNIQVYKTFVSDANFIVDFVGRWIRLVFAYLLVKHKILHKDFTSPPKVLLSCHFPNFFLNSFPTNLSYLLNT